MRERRRALAVASLFQQSSVPRPNGVCDQHDLPSVGLMEADGKLSLDHRPSALAGEVPWFGLDKDPLEVAAGRAAKRARALHHKWDKSGLHLQTQRLVLRAFHSLSPSGELQASVGVGEVVARVRCARHRRGVHIHNRHINMFRR